MYKMIGWFERSSPSLLLGFWGYNLALGLSGAFSFLSAFIFRVAVAVPSAEAEGAKVATDLISDCVAVSLNLTSTRLEVCAKYD